MISQFPHCDARILHAPRGYVDDGAFISQDGVGWTLCILPTAAAPWSPEHSPTSPANRVPQVIPRFAIRLTQPAWSVLMSEATTTASSESRQSPSRVSANGVELNIVRGSVPIASDAGARSTPQLLSGELNLHRLSGNARQLVGSSFGTHVPCPALIVVPVFLGTSWTLITAAGGEVREMRLSPALPAEGTLSVSRPSWLNAISSVLTAIKSGLTSEQWNRESERLSRGECRYCDAHPDWQELRSVWNIAYSGRSPEHGQTACPADTAVLFGERGDYNQWGGNVPETGDDG